MSFRRALVAVLMLLASAVAVPSQTTPAPAGPVQPLALTVLNNAFRAAYADAKSRPGVLRSDSDRQRRQPRSAARWTPHRSQRRGADLRPCQDHRPYPARDLCDP